jgi:circadian clock protein KaiC
MSLEEEENLQSQASPATSSTSADNKLRRLSTGIAGLDRITQGGFLVGGIYIIMGSPGAGKTIMGNQICFQHVTAALPTEKGGVGRAVYVTLLSETHGVMLSHLQDLKFFNREKVGDALYYISGYNDLEKDGLKGLLHLLRTTIIERKASLLVIDGLSTAELVANSELNFKRFINDLHAYSQVTNCTTLMLSHASSTTEGLYPEYTMVDGLLELSERDIGMHSVRELQLHKFRGSATLRGKHLFEIGMNGIEVYPRTEALLALPTKPIETSKERLRFNIDSLDTMLGGGILASSNTILQGVPGSGKTLLGLHFLASNITSPTNHQPQTTDADVSRSNDEANATRENVAASSLYFGFYESPSFIISAAASVGLDLASLEEQGSLEIIWQPPLESNPDALAAKLLEAVRRRKVQRLFVDGLEGFWETAVYLERMPKFFTALSNELRALGVTTIFSAEIQQFLGSSASTRHISSLVENTILLRYLELGSRLHRVISILKQRETGYDSTIREFKIGSEGLIIGESFNRSETLLARLDHHDDKQRQPSTE